MEVLVRASATHDELPVLATVEATLHLDAIYERAGVPASNDVACS